MPPAADNSGFPRVPPAADTRGTQLTTAKTETQNEERAGAIERNEDTWTKNTGAREHEQRERVTKSRASNAKITRKRATKRNDENDQRKQTEQTTSKRENTLLNRIALSVPRYTRFLLASATAADP